MPLTTVMGIIVVVALIALLLTDRLSAPIALIMLPLIAALILGFSITDIAKWSANGFVSAASNCVVAIFAVTYFAMMNDQGIFDGIINAVTKKIGNSVVMAFVICWLVAVITSLGANSAPAILVTAPTMYPIFKKMKIRPINLAFIISLVAGIFQYLPYSSMTMSASVAMKTDASKLWLHLMPTYIFGLALSLVVSIIFGLLEGKRIAAHKNDALALAEDDSANAKTVERSDWHRKTRVFNLLLTAVLLVVLLTNLITASVVFVIALFIALVVNFPNVRGQIGVIRKYAPMSMFVVLTFLTAGAYGTIMGKSGMMTAMVKCIISIFPASIGAHVPFILGVFGVPLGFVLGGAAYYNGLMPVLGGMASSYGISTTSYCATMMLGKGIGMLCSPTTPNLYLLTDMCKVSPKEYFKYAFLPLWLISIIVLIFGCIVGVATF